MGNDRYPQSRSSARSLHHGLVLCRVLGVATLIALPATSQGAPEGAEVRTPGSVTITFNGPDTLIDQSAERAIIDWRSFNVAEGETVRFQHRNDTDATLNRVTGGLGASTIDGSVTANGRIYIINDQGILFGENASVNVGSLIATTADLSDEDQQRFLDSGLTNSLSFVDGDVTDGAIINRGGITIGEGGLVALVGPRVVNEGRIVAQLGRVELASAGRFTIDLDPAGQQLVNFEVDRTLLADMQRSGNFGIVNAGSGRVTADGGTVVISAQGVTDVLDNLINLDGIVQANSLERTDVDGVVRRDVIGSIRIGASEQQTNVVLSGSLLARDDRREVGQRFPDDLGGDISISGNQIELTADSSIDVSADDRGGVISVQATGNASSTGALSANRIEMAAGSIDFASTEVSTGDDGAISGLDAIDEQSAGLFLAGRDHVSITSDFSIAGVLDVSSSDGWIGLGARGFDRGDQRTTASFIGAQRGMRFAVGAGGGAIRISSSLFTANADMLFDGPVVIAPNSFAQERQQFGFDDEDGSGGQVGVPLPDGNPDDLRTRDLVRRTHFVNFEAGGGDITFAGTVTNKMALSAAESRFVLGTDSLPGATLEARLNAFAHTTESFAGNSEGSAVFVENNLISLSSAGGEGVPAGRINFLQGFAADPVAGSPPAQIVAFDSVLGRPRDGDSDFDRPETVLVDYGVDGENATGDNAVSLAVSYPTDPEGAVAPAGPGHTVGGVIAEGTGGGIVVYGTDEEGFGQFGRALEVLGQPESGQDIFIYARAEDATLRINSGSVSFGRQSHVADLQVTGAAADGAPTANVTETGNLIFLQVSSDASSVPPNLGFTPDSVSQPSFGQPTAGLDPRPQPQPQRRPARAHRSACSRSSIPCGTKRSTSTAPSRPDDGRARRSSLPETSPTTN